jgi:trans-2,3-dihydro-3-hydroxyanthranilate isomerase
MPTYRFYQIDVFTNEPLGGNALAVFPDPEGLSPQQMQGLAREFNLSETTFVFPSEVATRKVRFFTPLNEIPLAGHPTVGTWWTLAELGRLGLPDDGTHECTQETGAGVLPVYLELNGGRPVQVTMVQATPAFGVRVEDTAGLADALGGAPDLIPPSPPPQVVSTGLPQLMIPTVSLDALRQLPSGGAGLQLTDRLREYGTECAMLYATETESPEATVHCRMFAPGLGVTEDPATGSASGALGAYLVRHGVVRPEEGRARIVVEQGLEIQRPSIIRVEVRTGPQDEITEVRVGGEAITVIEGEVRL